MTNSIDNPDAFPPRRLSFSLRENGLHSLQRGIEALQKHEENGDSILLRDAIIFLHHGIELLMKEVLSQHSPYLIFENLTDAAKKQKEADKQRIGIFLVDPPPRTVSFEQAIARVEAFVKPAGLTDDLRQNLTKLNNLRNQVEHYAIDVERDEVVELLGSLRGPVMDLFEGTVGAALTCKTSKSEQEWKAAESIVYETRTFKGTVISLLHQFKGQTVPGSIFCQDQERFVLPTFSTIQRHYRIPGFGLWADIFCEGDNVRWVVEVKRHIGSPDSSTVWWIQHASEVLKATAWLVVSTDSTIIREAAQRTGILATDHSGWLQLRRLLLPA